MPVHTLNEPRYTEHMPASSGDRGETRARVRAVLIAHAQLGGDLTGLRDASDLYEAGMTSRASVSVMLALENEFQVEFPDAMLRRDVFQSVDAIASAIERLLVAH
jgi:acyl carrier protein